MPTMVLGGLWHGAGWTFVIWGDLHGLDQPETAAPGRISGQANSRWAMFMAMVLGFGLLSLTRPSEFLYFQF